MLETIKTSRKLRSLVGRRMFVIFLIFIRLLSEHSKMLIRWLPQVLHFIIQQLELWMKCHATIFLYIMVLLCVCLFNNFQAHTFKYSQWTYPYLPLHFIVISVIRNTGRINFYYWWNERKKKKWKQLEFNSIKLLSSFHSFSPLVSEQQLLRLHKHYIIQRAISNRNIWILIFFIANKKKPKQIEQRPSSNRVWLATDSVLLLNRITSVPDISQRENHNYSQPVRIWIYLKCTAVSSH